MTLAELLEVRVIRSALIVDDVCDLVPTAADIGADNEAWSVLNDDLTQAQRTAIAEAYPKSHAARFDELVADDGYVAALWSMRDQLCEAVAPLFGQYLIDQAADERFVRLIRTKLEAVGLTCVTRGRNFADAALEADLIVIDLFFGGAQDETSLEDSKRGLKAALAPRASTPPMVILMSRSNRLEAKRDEFRDDVGLIESGFRIVGKSDLERTDRLERQLERLADNADDTRKLARFFAALEAGMVAATSRTLRLMRNLKLSDVGQIQQLLLSVEGEAAGSYLVDVFDRVLQHEIERDAGIIDAAIALNDFSVARHPPPFVAGSAELQDMVQRLLTQNRERLRLKGTVDGPVTFGDILRARAGDDPEQLRNALLVDLAADAVLLVLTPACDLQRKGVPRILLLVGTIKPLELKDWSYGNDARTSSIAIDGVLHWVRWDLKHIDTVSWKQLQDAIGDGGLRVVARLREPHAIELQQRLLSGLGRVGAIATLPATFPVGVEAYYVGLDQKAVRLDVPALSEDAVCFVGRDAEGGRLSRLIMTEGACDGIERALAALSQDQVAESARKAFAHVRDTADLRKMMAAGLELTKVRREDWTLIASETGQEAGVPKMGLIAWNYTISDEPIKKHYLNKAGVILLVKDNDADDAPGLTEAILLGAVRPPVAAEDNE